jgi:eukaryotic-like serine/threonine-protein kinase
VALPPYDRRRLKEVFAGARALPASHRQAYLSAACAGNEALRQEVESLLASDECAKSFLESPAVIWGDGTPHPARLRIEGRRLGAYQVQALLGAGGMGEVYRARDTKLQRDVAVKFLPHAFTRDPERLARFEREARTLAALNHPNIGAIYGFEEADGLRFLILELVAGPTLADRLAKGPLRVAEALIAARQIAEALEAAHEKGIVHRDLKPANIKLMLDGSVKVLDFGLAKAAGGDAALDLTQTPTKIEQTREGAIVGTVGYMSPEQASGKPADKRCDLWAFGVVLFEMLTARSAFAGETTSHVLAAVLTAAPDWSTLPAETPAPIRKLLRRCLEKDRKRRLESAADARLEIDEVLTAAPAEVGGVVRQRHPWLKWAIAASALTVAMIGVAAAVTRLSQPAVRPMHFAIPVGGEVAQLAVSSDGKLLAFVTPDETTGKNILAVQAIGDQHAVPLVGTEGASYPFWSPDSQYIGFFAESQIMKVRAGGGAVQIVVPVTMTARGASWGANNVIVYSQRAGGPLWRVNADGTGASVLTEALLADDERSHRWPMFLPDGDRFLFWAGNFSTDGARSGIYLSSLSARQKVFLVEARSNPGFAQDGYLFFVDGKGRLGMQAFDPDTGRVTGDLRVIADAVGFQPSLYFGAFAVSSRGTVVLNPTSAVSQSLLTWYDRAGKELGSVGSPAILYNPSLSPDGQRLAADIADPKAANVDVWTFDVRQGTSGRFTFGPLEEATPVWAPDGNRLAYGSADNGIEAKSTTGLEKERVIADRPSTRLALGGGLVSPNSWAPNGEYMVARVDGFRQEPSYLALLKIGEPTLSRMLASKGNQANGQISPDGKWLAYATDDSGGWNIFVTAFPSAAGRWQVSVGGGTEPRWRGDGKEIFYLDTKGMLMAVPVGSGPTFSSGTAHPLFRVRSRAPTSNTDVFSYDVSKDGSRFIVNRYVKPSSVPPLDIWLNATAAPETRD